MKQLLPPTAESYKADPESVYNTSFISNEERLKAFQSIRRGVGTVVDDIKHGHFPNDFKGSSPEFVLGCIAEQKQVAITRSILITHGGDVSVRSAEGITRFTLSLPASGR